MAAPTIISSQYNLTVHAEYRLLVNATLHACTWNTNKGEILKHKILFVKNQFILRLRYDDFDAEDKSAQNVLIKEGQENLLQWQQLKIKEPEAIYLVHV